MAFERFIPGLSTVNDNGADEVFLPGLGTFVQGGLAALSGSMAATETGADTLAAAGGVLVSGGLAATESGTDTFFATNINRGNFAATESGQDTFSADGGVPVSGALSATESGADTFAAGGKSVFTVRSGHALALGLSLASPHTAILRGAIESGHTAVWDILGALVSGHTAPLGDAVPITSGHTAGWDLRTALISGHEGVWELMVRNPFASAHRARWDLAGWPAQQQSVAYAVTVGGVSVAVSGLEVSQDEAGYWVCSVELAETTDYGRFATDVPFSVQIGATAWAMLTDRRTRQRRGAVEWTARVNGIGLAAQWDEPRAEPVTKTWDAPILASAAVTELLGSVDWQMVDWLIPAYRLAADGAVPVAVARRIVEAAGGVLQFEPDGTATARAEFPVTVPDFATAAADAVISETNHVYEMDEILTREALINRVRIYDTDGAGFADRIEFEADSEDPLGGRLRVYPSPWRETVQVRTTAGLRVSLTRLGTTTRTVEGERVEFKEGAAQTRYPIMQLQSVEWITDDLGALVHDEYGSVLHAAVADYSLALIGYTTKSVDYTAEASQETPAQMLVEDVA